MGKIRTLLIVTGLCSWTGVLAVEWEVEPSISLAETFTSNADLQQTATRDEFVTEILPAIKIIGTGKRFDVDLNYKLQGMVYARRDEFNEVLNYARARGTATLAEEALFVDFDGSLNQQIINPNGRIGISGVSGGENRTEVAQFAVSPYWERNLGQTSNIKIAYRSGFVDYDAAQLVDSRSNGIHASIAGQPPRSPFSWRADVIDTRIDYDDSSDVRLRRLGVEGGWAFTGQTELFIGGGDEDNQFDRPAGGRKVGGSFWNVGLRGNLDRLTTYSFSAGEQHFGESFQFDLKRVAGQLSTEVSYLEETTTVGRQQEGYEAMFQFLSDITGVELPTAGADVYVRKRLAAVAELEFARSHLRLNLYDESRDYLTSAPGDSDSVMGMALSWTWAAYPRTEVSVDLGWQQFDLRTSNNDPEDVRLQMRVHRDMRDDVFVNLRVWRNSRFANTAATEYDENAISIGVGKRF